MKFSILLPTHNRADVLPFAINSVSAQTEVDWELLVVGDGCSDNTGEIVSAFADSRIEWFDLPKAPGFGYANRNFGLRKTRGEYIAFLAHDDVWLPDHLALLACCLEEGDTELAYSRPLWVEPGGVILPGDFDITDAVKREAFLSMRQSGIPSSCVMHRRACFGKYGFWDESLPCNADWDMWARILAGTGRAGYLPSPTCLHFRASWRNESNVVSRLADHPEIHARLPALQLPASRNDQQAAWQAIETDPLGWAEMLRLSVKQADEWIIEKERQNALAFENSSHVLLGPCGYVIRAINDDPQLILPEFDSHGCEPLLLRIEIASPVATVFQLFYRTQATPHYTEQQSIKREINPLRSILHFCVDARDITGALRIDPGTVPGDYIILSIEVRAAR